MSGSNRKFGRNKNRPADKRYLGEKRWVKNKAKAIESHAEDVKEQQAKVAARPMVAGPRVRKPKAVKASPQRASTLRQAFLDCKVVYGKTTHAKLGKCVDHVMSAIERSVGLVRVTHHYNLTGRTVKNLQQAGIL